ncbi:endonuclease V [Candidatus Pacearchaeota archaeon]|nr:endonuclease V [Candidatus Pacearchaeota archaeon]
MAEEFDEKIKEIIKRFDINIAKLEAEQIRLAKTIKLKDSIDFELVERIAGCSNSYFNNHIVSAIVVLNSDLEIVEQKYSEEKMRFPYIPGFRAYRELPAMVSCFHKLEERPDVVFIAGHGASHPRLGLASHFSLLTGIPTIGIAHELLEGQVRDKKIYLNGKIVGEELLTKEGSRPIYVSPGNMISLNTAVKLVNKLIKTPHKLPEPLIQARKYAKKIVDELGGKGEKLRNNLIL